MKPLTPFSFTSVSARCSKHRLALLCCLAFAVPLAPAAEGGMITGSVGNAATGNHLEGAVIEVPQLGLSTLTDNTGTTVTFSVSGQF